ncbi:MAG: hypothetical protein MUC87_07520 [Bacteroidia bacterium]|jgi:hypothetical protein|nr:hypothetical protein [Bacteroidia bacterium]
MAAPVWQGPAPKLASGAVALKHIFVNRNQYNDPKEWMKENNLPDYFWSLPNDSRQQHNTIPATFPLYFNNNVVTSAWHNKGIVYYVYSDSLLFVADSASGEVICAYDFGAYLISPQYIKADEPYIKQSIRFALLYDSVLYMTNYHNTYSHSTAQQNAYITAIDIRTHTVKWRSNALINNSPIFAIYKNYLICGYGFSSEPDFIYILDNNNGKVVSSFPVKTEPQMIYVKGIKLYLLISNENYEYELIL